MRILFVTPYFYPAEAFGGPVKVAFDVGRELVRRGHEVVVFTSDAKDLENRLDVERDEIEGMQVYYFRNLFMSLVKWSKLFITPDLPKKMMSDLKSFDIVHVHEYTTYQNIVVHHFAKKFGVPYVLQAHGSLPKIGRQARKWIYDAFFGSTLLRDASKVIALSEIEAEQYKCAGVPAEKIAIVPNGIDLTEYSDLPPKGSFKKKFGLEKNEKIVLYLGRIHEIKGIDILVRAFANILHKLDDVRLVIVGPDDGYLGEIEALIKALKIENKVLISGPLYGKDKLEAYVDADVYVLSSIYEIFGISLLEAYACSTPVIASSVGGLKDLVINGETGFLVEPGSIVELSRSIVFMIDNSASAKRMGMKGREFVKNFSAWTVINRLECLYDEIASKTPCKN
ncbi:MAG: glycosyltransferase [Candidatus Bathyarchaeia archaeon]